MFILKEKYNKWIYNLFSYIIQSKKIEDINNNDLSKIFEYYSCIQLSLEKNQLFYHYDDINPSFKEENYLTLVDTGIDACNMIDTIVQAKLRKDTLNWSDCSTFFASCYNFCDKSNQLIIKWPTLIITRNCESKLSKHLLERKKIFIDKTYNRIDIINYCNKLLLNPPLINSKNENFKLRDYQENYINLIKKSTKNIILCLPTGSGKNIIVTYSLDFNKKYLILVPRIILLEQIKNDIILHFPTLKNNIQTIGDGNNVFDDNINITICVYNSVNIINSYINTFDKIFIDEAHNIYKPNIYSTINENEEENLVKIDDSEEEDEKYTDIIKSFNKYNNNICLSATIDEQPNFDFYKKDIREMINDNYLVDYTLHIPIFNNDPTNKNICEYLISKYFHIIIYCNNQIEGKKFNKLLNQLQNNCSEYIDCNTSKKQRNIIIEKFKQGELRFLVNIRILVEGFDAPITKGVCFIHLPSSKTSIIQIIGRSLRLHPEKTISNIILPYSTDSDSDNINHFLKILAYNDSRIKKSYINKQLGGYINIIKRNIEQEVEKDDNIQFRYEQIFNSLGESLNFKTFTPKEKRDILLDYVNEYNKVPIVSYKHKIDDQEVNLGIFYNNLKKGQNKEVLKELIERSNIIKKDIERFNKEKEERKDKRTFSPKEKRDMILDYVNEYKKIPVFSYKHKIDDQEVNLGIFYNNLKKGQNKEVLKELIERSNIIKKDIERFNKEKEERKDKRTFSPKEKRDMMLDYINEYNKVPLQNYIYKIDDQEVKLGKFYDNLKQGHNKDILKELIEKSDIIKKDIERFNKEKEERKN